MKKKFKLLYAVAIVAVASYGIYASQKSNVEMSDLMLANVEALADPETSEEFTAYTGCEAVLYNAVCRGKDGNRYSYAIKK